MSNFDATKVQEAMTAIIAPNASIHMCHPFGDLVGPTHFYEQCYADLFQAFPDLERRDFIVMGGQTNQGDNWVGCAGHYMGTFTGPWLNIPPTGHLTHMRFHEYYRIENGQVVEVQALWDIPEVMLQARAWPMAPSLGREGLVPGPATQDGLNVDEINPEQTAASIAHVVDMLAHLSLHPSQGGPEIMEAERFWHPRVNWYGPAGIGTARGIAGFRNWHQIPFLNALPDRRGGTSGECVGHRFAQGNYVCVTGWPNMQMTVTGDGWLGIVPTGQKITMRSLDFWRVEDGLIRENWVLVDILHVYAQLGVDVFARLKEFNKARRLQPM